MKLQTLATEAEPMRISSTPTFMQCAGFYVCRSQEIEEDRQAAINGTTVGRAVELWHRGASPEEAIEQAVAENPTAQRRKIGPWFDGYRMDPRNGKDEPYLDFGAVLPEFQEAEVRLEVDGCYFTGHIDQLREKNDQWRVWDLKASSFGGGVLLGTYAVQLSMYTLACAETFNRPVLPGGFIRMTSYAPRATVGAFYPAQWTYEDCELLAQDVVSSIKDARRGKLQLRPGHQCSYCPGGGLGTCRKIVQQAIVGRCPVCGQPAKPNRVTCCRPECIRLIHRNVL